MDPSRWKQIDGLLDAALDLDPDKRPAFLDHACAGNDELRKEVESLLASGQGVGSFMELPALHATAKNAESSPDKDRVFALLNGKLKNKATLHAGQIVSGRYEILAKLGSGGMGDVWRAFDKKLRVDVALKTLRTHITGSGGPVEAFRNEVRRAREVISPNVCRIFDLIDAEDQELISMEYIDGMTLHSLLQQKGPITYSEALDIASQFLAGLETIHQSGLVHCDLKPENIMITRTGRVVIMDFGIAKEVKQTDTAISGTPAYMAPELINGAATDARSDLFSSGVILAEMIHPPGIVSQKTREEIWSIVYKTPQQLPDNPWKAVILKAVSPNPDFRFASARSLSRALEEATELIERKEERGPYPGLASFTSSDAHSFLGRELEVENALKKLEQQHLMALVGASGAGKTSFLRAGLIPALPAGWSSIFCVPGDSPLTNLRQALDLQFSSDAEMNQGAAHALDSEVIGLLRRWRKENTEAVLIIDRFEELFTLNPPDMQIRFAALIGEGAQEADVRVLLSIRDDFLLRCHEHSALAPIFSELTPLGPLTGPALRRAFVQPALKCGYRFEDETLVDDILSDVEKERGALPLMAFAASRLWEKRDRTRGQLTRGAYVSIGGVAGALAQHAEETMERIGSERQPIVREIFRNLITAENTRAARDTEELLSVFDSALRGSAEEILRMLIDARLVTSYETPQAESEERKRRVEIIHESLLSNWPRLVHWQTQDADSARLRDQLRQASQIWEQRAKPVDLLWTGSSYQEFVLWRERYAGGLTPIENAFAHAMVQRAGKQRRNRRNIAAAVFFVLLGIIALIINFWREATASRDRAVSEAQRAEAGRVLATGRAIPDAPPTTKLAYALASLELADTPQGRRFALQALYDGPIARVLDVPLKPLRSVEFSPDGKWIAAGVKDGLQLFPVDGSPPVTLSEPTSSNYFVPWNAQFSPDSKYLIWTERKDSSIPRIVKIWSVSQKNLIRTFNMEGKTWCLVRNGKALFMTEIRSDKSMKSPEAAVRIWNFQQSEPELLGNFPTNGIGWENSDIDSNGRWIAYTKEKGIYFRSLEASGIGGEQLVGSTDAFIVRFRPHTEELVSTSRAGEIKLWSLSSPEKKPLRVISGNGQEVMNLSFDSRGTFLYALRESTLFRWDLTAPDAEPLVSRQLEKYIQGLTFDPHDHWMAIGGQNTLALYLLSNRYPYVLRGAGSGSNPQFTQDGKALLSGFSTDGIRLWNIPGKAQYTTRTLWNSETSNAEAIDLDPHGNNLLAATPGDGVHFISMADGSDRILKSKEPDRFYTRVEFSPDGQSAAAIGARCVEVWNLLSDESRILEQSRGIIFSSLAYSPDGSLFAGDVNGNIHHWNLKDNSVKILRQGKGQVSDLAVSNNGRYLVSVIWSVENPQRVLNATSEFELYDLKEKKLFPITSHGNRVFCVAFDSGGSRLVTGDYDGIVRVGPMTGETPHLLLGHEDSVQEITVDPTGQWIASTESDMFRSTVRLWRIPEGKPLHELPNNELLNRLRDLTNVRAVTDKNSSTGYRIEYAGFPGWTKIPSLD